MSGNGSESSKNKASYTTIHHYYRVLKTFFTWCVNEEFLKESPMVKIKFANPKLKIIQPYTNKEIQNIKATIIQRDKVSASFVDQTMEIDPTLLEKVQGENEEFKKLYQEHLDLKHRVEELNKMNFLTPELELEKKTVQKQKLKGKDRMTQIIEQYQASPS